tara:strand:- start:101 stop:1246 length:1146 start_codon:yes stop_codon:yes gene_type:complete
MKKTFIFLLFLLLSFPAQAKIKSKDIKFPGKFYTNKIETCTAMPDTTFELDFYKKRVEGLIGYDWHADHQANSNSLVVNHDNITVPIKVFLAATHNAIGKNEKGNIEIAKKLLIDLAKANTLYDSISIEGLKSKPKCWANNDPNSPCWYHEYEFARGVFSNYMIGALWLKSELTKDEFKIVNKYIKKMYKKFLKPVEFKKQDAGIYQMANGGASTLVYASWTNNKKLAAKEINFRFKELDKLIYDDGYINNNSFRGYRGQWYHSYGLNITLGYVYVAKLWGAKIPEKLQKKIINSAKVANLAIMDWEKFKSREYKGKNINKISDPSNAIKHTHQMAIAIDKLMEVVTGIKLENDPVYLQKRKMHLKDGIDDLIGFNPNCIK